MHFEYGQTELNYLKSKDKKLAKIIDEIGFIKKQINPNLFLSLIQNIIAQQISGKAARSVWERFEDKFKSKNGKISPKSVANAQISDIQALGMSLKKATYISEFATLLANKKFDIKGLEKMSDNDAIKALSSLKGVGVWTAEMLLLFSLGRKNIFSYGDFGIKKGLEILYNHEKIDKKLFEKYRKKFSPYGSVASFYLWAVANGKIASLTNKSAKPQIYYWYYNSALGQITMKSDDGINLSELRFGKFDENCSKFKKQNLQIFKDTAKWLDIYFSGNLPNFTPKISLNLLKGSKFSKQILQILLQIPYGEVVTYGQIASIIATQKGVAKISAQAVGTAVGKNPIAIIIPCHRVIGKNGKLTGYAYGVDKKEFLLNLEKIGRKFD